MADIISADEIKKQLPNYSPDKAEDFHHESTHQADKLFSKTLKSSSLRDVILLYGGTASGKTEFLSTQLIKKDCIIFDATLSNQEFAKNKIREIKKRNKHLIVYSVIPDDLKRAFTAFLNRERKFSDTHFYKTHAGSRKTLLWIAQNYPDIEINIVESSYSPSGKLQFLQIQFDNRQKLTEYLTGKQLTENDIISYIGS